MNVWNPFLSGMTILEIDKVVKNQVRKNKSVVYGAQAIKHHIGFMARPTQDWDILTNNPQKAARQLQMSLVKRSRSNDYFIKQAKYPGTIKVKHKGVDGIANTKDDLEVADFTLSNKPIQTVTYDGVRYVALNEVVKDKKKSLRDEESAFRHQKDLEDLKRIEFSKQFLRRKK